MLLLQPPSQQYYKFNSSDTGKSVLLFSTLPFSLAGLLYLSNQSQLVFPSYQFLNWFFWRTMSTVLALVFLLYIWQQWTENPNCLQVTVTNLVFLGLASLFCYFKWPILTIGTLDGLLFVFLFVQ